MKKSFIFSSAELLNKDVDDLSLDNGFSSPEITVNHFFDKSLIFCKIKFKKSVLSDPGGLSVVCLF